MSIDAMMAIAACAQFLGAMLLLLTGPGIAGRVIGRLQELGRLHFDDIDRRTLEALDARAVSLGGSITKAAITLMVVGMPAAFLLDAWPWVARIFLAIVVLYLAIVIRRLLHLITVGRGYFPRMLLKVAGTGIFRWLRIDTHPEISLTLGLVLVVLGTGLQAAASVAQWLR